MSSSNDNDLSAGFLDDDDGSGRFRAATLETIEEGDEDENSDLEHPSDAKNESNDSNDNNHNQNAAHAPGTATVVASTFQLANCAIGAGVLAFPYAFANCGLAFGVLILVYLTVIVGFSQLIVIKASAATGARSYEDMVRMVLGNAWGTVLEVVVLVYQFGACVAYLDVIADQGTGIICQYGRATFGKLCSDPNQTLLRAVLVGIIAGGFCIPFSIPRKIDALAKVSLIGVLAPITMSMAIVVLGVIDMSERGMDVVFSRLKWTPDEFTGLQDVLKSIPMILFALQLHIVTPSVYAELKPEVQSVRNLSKATVFAYIMVAACYMITGIFGYTLFGNGVNGDLLKTDTTLARSKGDVLVAVVNGARGFIALGSLCSYPLNHFPARSALLNLVAKGRQDSLPTWGYYLEAILFVAVTYGLAIAVPQISYVFSIMGATCGTAVMMLFPALVQFYLPGYQRKKRLLAAGGEEFDDDDAIDDVAPEPEGSMVDVVSGRKTGGRSRRKNEKPETACAVRCRWITCIFYLVFGGAVVVTGTSSAVQDFIANLG